MLTQQVLYSYAIGLCELGVARRQMKNERDTMIARENCNRYLTSYISLVRIFVSHKVGLKRVHVHMKYSHVCLCASTRTV